MANTPKATDGETPKKRTRKAASAPEDSTKVTKSVKKVAAKPTEVAAVAVASTVKEAKPEVKEVVKSEVFVPFVMFALKVRFSGTFLKSGSLALMHQVTVWPATIGEGATSASRMLSPSLSKIGGSLVLLTTSVKLVVLV